MIPVGYTFRFAMQTNAEISYSTPSVQASSPGSVCTVSSKTDANSFCSSAGNAPATDYSRPTAASYLHQSVTQTIEGNEDEKKKSEKVRRST